MQLHPQMAGHGAVPYPGTPHHPHPGQVEFGPSENAIIARTAGRARTWGIVAMVVGGLATLGLVGAFVAMELVLSTAPSSVAAYGPRLILGALIPAAIVHLAVGVVYMRAGGALQEVVDTQGDDLGHLMTALGRLRLAFQIECVVTVLAFVVGLVVGIASGVMNAGAS